MGWSAEASVASWVRPDALASRRVVAATPLVAAATPLEDAAAMQQSLRRDVEEHPAEFVVFATEAGANQFVTEHRESVAPETNSMIVSRGLVGYWQGKTIVVLPWEPLKNFQ